MKNSQKQILYFDLDNVLVDFQSGINRITEATYQQYEGRLDEVPGIFSLMDPMPGALDAFQQLSEVYDSYILSTAPWENPSAWSDKLKWVKEYLGEKAYKRLILSHHKDLNRGDYLIDDRKKNGAAEFEGELIPFGSDEFPDWDSVVNYLMPQPLPSTYRNIQEILTLTLPQRQDTYLHRIRNEEQLDKELGCYYEEIIGEKVDQIKEGKYGNLDHEDLYDPASGWYEDTQSFTFEIGDYDIIVNIVDLSIDPEGNFNQVLAHIECEVLPAVDEDADVPDELQALEFEGDCEFECLEEVLDTLFTEIGKCEKKYNNEYE